MSGRRFANTVAAALMALCAAAFAAPAQSQQAPPTSRPSGVLGAADNRVPITPDAWPWSSIGRINVVMGMGHRGYCTGTLIGPRQVVTAAHCLFDTRLNTWVKPGQVHFVAGQARDDKFKGHSIAASLLIAPDFKFAVEDRPRYDLVRSDMIHRDWAIITLSDALNLKPVPLRAMRKADLPNAAEPGEVARAGYSQDRPYMPSVHRGCSVKTDVGRPGALEHRCDSLPGDSGSPILLLQGDTASVIGIHTVSVQDFQSGVGYTAKGAAGVSASAFEEAATALIGK